MKFKIEIGIEEEEEEEKKPEETIKKEWQELIRLFLESDFKFQSI